jgi:predicted transcriptional regulator
MARNSQDVTDAELAVLRVLWDDGPANIREITAKIYPTNTESDYATVKKLLARLEQKNFVSRDRGLHAHRFEAKITLDDLLAKRLQGLADNLCGGSQTPLLMHLLRTDDVTPVQRQKLRDLIQDITAVESKPKRRGKNR